MNNTLNDNIINMKQILRTLMLSLMVLCAATAGAQVATTPYLCDFEDPLESQLWILNNGPDSIVNRWYIDTAVNNTAGGTRSLYVSSDTGQHHYYADSVPCMVVAYRDIQLTQGLYSSSFDWICAGEEGYDFLIAALVPADDTVSLLAGSELPYGLAEGRWPENWISLSSGSRRMASSSLWTRSQKEFTIDTSQTYRFVFIFRNDSTYGGNISAAIDNLRLKQITCFPPTGLQVNADTLWARLEWDAGSSETQWLIAFGDTSYITTADTFVVSGLSPATFYDFHIYALCDNGDTSRALYGYFNTLCQSIAHQQLPYRYGFEYAEGQELCWHYGSNNDYMQPGRSGTAAHTGMAGLRIRSTEHDMAYAATPWFDDNVDDLMISMYMRNGGETSSTLVVGTLADPADPNTFWAVDTITVTGSEMQLYEIPINAVATAHTIVLLCDSGAVNDILIDDIVIEPKLSCGRIHELTNPILTAGSATFEWVSSSIGTYTGAIVQYRDTMSFDWQSITATGAEALLMGLEYNMAYEVRVAAQCGAADTAPWVNIVVTTAATNCNIYDASTLRHDTIADYTSLPHFEVPINNWHNYSFSEQLYTAAELDTAGTISAIQFRYLNDTLPMSGKDSIEIYMAVTTRSSLTTSDFIHPNDMTLVYRGGLNCSAGWNTFEFNERYFNYDGRNNLVIAVVDRSGASLNSHYRFSTHSATSKTIAFLSDTYTFDNYLLMEPYEYPFRSDLVMRFSECSAESECYAPLVIPGGVGYDTVSFSLIPGGHETAWHVYVQPMGGDAEYVVTTWQHSHTITDLEPSTTYTIRVVGDCEDSLYTEFSVTTKCLPQAVPFADDFTSWPVGASPIVPSCWVKHNPLGANLPYIYPFAVDGQQSVLFLFSNATSHSYVALPELAPAIDSLQISFLLYREYNSGNNSNSDHPLLVGIMTDADDIATFHPIDTVVSPELNHWHLVEMPLNSFMADSTLDDEQKAALRHGRIALLSPDGIYSHPYIDDILVEYIPRCSRPTGLVKNSVRSTADSLWVSWDNTTDILGWQVMVESPDAAGLTTSQVYFTIDSTIGIAGLNPASVYTISVRTICADFDGNGNPIHTDTSKLEAADFRTNCGAIKYSPYIESFELNAPGTAFSTGFAQCWQRLTGPTNYPGIPYVSDETGYYSDCHSGERGINWSAEAGALYPDYQYMVSPAIDTALLPMGTLQVDFWARSHSGSRIPEVTVGAISEVDGTVDSTTFQPVATIAITSTGWRKYTAYFNTYSGDATHIAFRVSRPEEDWEFSLDDIEIGTMGACPPVSGIVLTGADVNALTIDWTDHAGATAWDIEYGPIGFEPGYGTYAMATSHPYTLSGLASATGYEIHVTPVCDEPGGYTSALFYTIEPYAALPFYSNYSDAEVNSLWHFSDEGLNPWYIGTGADTNGNMSMYISDDGGVTNHYGGDVSTISYAYVNVIVSDSGRHHYRFDWRSRGNAGYDFLRVALVPASFAPVATNPIPTGFAYNNLPAGWIALDGGAQMVNNTQWLTREGEVEIATPGLYRLLFSWFNYAISYDRQPPAAIDNVMLRRVTCQTPTGIQITPYDETMLVDWTSNGDEGAWVVSTQDTTYVAYSHPYLIGGLTPNTSYDITVRALCGEGDTSLAASVSESTTCPANELPYYENFDTLTSITQDWTEFLPNCWFSDVFGSDGTRSPMLYYLSNYAHSGNYSMFMGREAYLKMRPVDRNINLVTLSFWHYVNNASYGVQVGVMEGPTFVPIQTFYGTEGQYVQHTVDFLNYTGTSRVIAFHNINPSSIGAPIFIDDIAVEPIPNCMPVMNINVPTTSTTELYIDWTDITEAESWEIEYGPEGFAQGSGTLISVATHPFHVTGLDTLTSYDFYVHGICNDTTFSDWAGPVHVSTTFCDEAVIFSTGTGNGTNANLPLSTFRGHNMTEVIIDSAELAGLGDLTAVAFYYGSSEATTVKDSVQIYLMPTTLTTFDNDFAMVNLDESIATLVYNGPMSCVRGWNYFNFESNYVWDGFSNLIMILVDNTGHTEATNGYLFRSTPCGAYKSIVYNGAVAVTPTNMQGYSGYRNRYNHRPAMQLISCGAASCPVPSSLAATNISDTSATLHWQGASRTYQISFKNEDEELWSDPVEVSTTSNMGSHHIGGLEELTTYTYRIRQLCIMEVWSEWGEGTFTTLPHPCLSPEAPTVSDVTYDEATVDWQPGNAQSTWHLRLTTVDLDTVISAHQHPYHLSGLVHGYTYSVSIADSCTNNGLISSYSPVTTFTTTECERPTNVVASDITHNTAVVEWEGTAGLYTVEYGIGAFSQGNGITLSGITSNRVTLDNLEPNISYSVFVRQHCTAVSTSVWSQRSVFRTAEAQGIEEKDGSEGIAIYPNPAQGSTLLTISGMEGTIDVSVVDLQGRTVRAMRLDSCEATCTHRIELSGIPAGAYIVLVDNADKRQIRRLIVK